MLHRAEGGNSSSEWDVLFALYDMQAGLAALSTGVQLPADEADKDVAPILMVRGVQCGCR